MLSGWSWLLLISWALACCPFDYAIWKHESELARSRRDPANPDCTSFGANPFDDYWVLRVA